MKLKLIKKFLKYCNSIETYLPNGDVSEEAKLAIHWGLLFLLQLLFPNSPISPVEVEEDELTKFVVEKKKNKIYVSVVKEDRKYRLRIEIE